MCRKPCRQRAVVHRVALHGAQVQFHLPERWQMHINFPKPFAVYTSWEDNETIPKYRRRAPDTGGEARCGMWSNYQQQLYSAP